MKRNDPYRMRVKVWLYQGQAAWHFVTLPKGHSGHIKTHYGWQRKARRGWGSLRVEVTVGRTTWKTSIFPDAKSGCYLLPLKEKVRAAEGIQAGKTLSLTLKVVDPD